MEVTITIVIDEGGWFSFCCFEQSALTETVLLSLCCYSVCPHFVLMHLKKTHHIDFLWLCQGLLRVILISSPLFLTGGEVLPVSWRTSNEDAEDADSPTGCVQVLTFIHCAQLSLTF